MNRPAPTTQLPPQMSTFAADYDKLFYEIYWISVISFVLIVAFMTAYVWMYRRRPGHQAQVAGHNTALEILWTFSPLIVLGYLFVEGFRGYMIMQLPPPDALEIRVTASQWKWEFMHPNGFVETNTVTLPANRPVRMVMSSTDVLHSFYIPEFRVKRDVVPGMFTTMWFQPTHETGEQPVTLFCAEYCGAPRGIHNPPRGQRQPGEQIDNQNTNHSTMLAAVNIVPAERYEPWVEEAYVASLRPPATCQSEANPMACWGQQLYTQNCRSCHSVESGVRVAGPSWFGLFGSTRQFEGGTSTVADENYIRESMLQPNARVALGFPAIMSVQNMPQAKIDAIIAYMKTLH